MICPTCREAGQRSTVRLYANRPPGDQLPKDHYYDESGAEHSHNPNIFRTNFRCSLGHTFFELSSWECWCGYKACVAHVVASRVPTKGA
jgi:hypothetical protein